MIGSTIVSGPIFRVAATAMVAKNNHIILTPCFINPIYISPAPGRSEKINVHPLLFFLIIIYPP